MCFLEYSSHKSVHLETEIRDTEEDDLQQFLLQDIVPGVSSSLYSSIVAGL